MKISSLFSFFLLFPIASASKSGSFTNGRRYRNIECKSFNTSIMEFDYCYPKAFSRTEVTLNCGVKFWKPLVRPINVFISSFYRYGTIYREVIKLPPLEWCSTMETSIDNPLLKYFFAGVKNAEPVLKKCPFEGRLDIKNLTFPGGVNLPIFSTGFYKEVINVTMNKMPLCRVVMFHEIKSEIKNSFS